MRTRSPLFDIYDPYGILQQQAQYGVLPESDDGEIDPIGIAPLGERKAQVSDLMPEEEKSSLLRSLAAQGSSGLAGLGWILDTPGAVVRGALSGGPSKALSALWETSDDRVDGRELLRQYGLAGNKDNWTNFGGGLAAEMLLDPLTYASFGLNSVLGHGAKTLAGQAAQKSGLLDNFALYARNVAKTGPRQALREGSAEALLNQIPDAAARQEAAQRFFRNAGVADDAAAQADMLKAPLAKMNRVTLPFVTEGAEDIFGKGVGDYVAKTADALGEGIQTNRFTAPIANNLVRAFDPTVLGMTDYNRQWEARGIHAAEQTAMATRRKQLAGLQYDADKALREAGSSLNDPQFSQAFRTYMELGPENVPPEVSSLFDLPAVRNLTGFFEGYRDTAVAKAKQLGMPLEEYNSRAGTGFFPRQQLGFDIRQRPDWPTGAVLSDPVARPYSKGDRPVMFDDNMGRGRRDYTDVVNGSDTLNRMSMDPELQQGLRESNLPQARALFEDWAQRNLPEDAPDLYGWMDATDDAGDYIHKAPPLPADHPLMQDAARLQEEMRVANAAGELHRVPALKEQAEAIASQIPEAQREAYRDQMYRQLSGFISNLDPQHAAKEVPIFGQNSFNEMSRYVLGQERVRSNAEQMLQLLKQHADDFHADDAEGLLNYTPQEALAKLRLNGDTAMEVLEKTIGRPLDGVSFNKKFIDDYSRVIERGRMDPVLNPLRDAYDDYTKTFKTLALAWPSRYSRDLYSGGFAAAMKNSYNWTDRNIGAQIRRGDYSGLLQRISGLPDYKEVVERGVRRPMTDDEKIRKFLTDAGGQGLGTSIATDENLADAAGSQLKEMFPGAARPSWDDLRNRAANASWTDWLNPFSTRTASGNRNPILELADRTSETTDAINRYGTYLTQIRNGASPSEAKRIADLTQVNYAPEAFTNFERDYLKRIAPFYSYSRGITPLIADQLLHSPSGLMGKSIRAINRAGAPGEENFTPEYLRQSASIPVPTGLPLISLSGDSNLRRYLTNIDLPFESVINLLTPGVGNNAFDALGHTAQKTALNLLGQTNPLIKGPLEVATNRQFYSGRQLSDLYSMLEQSLGTPGRALENIAMNAPGGSRLIGTVRQLADQRLSAPEKAAKFAVNALTGLKFQDVDQERTRQLAARDTLNQLLTSTPGVRTYENVTVPEDVVRSMPEKQRQMYLLYKIIQSEASKRARAKKKAEAMLDPMQMLGLIQQG
jgi:hypothetical protein